MTEQLLEDLLSDPESFARNYQRKPPKFLYNDREICCLLRRKNKNACPGINRGYLGKRGKVGVPYLVEYNGHELILKTTNPGQLSIVHRKEPPSNIKSFDKIIDKAPSRCGYRDVDNLRYLGADEFTNEMLIGLILTFHYLDWNDITGNSFYPQIEYLTSSICQDTSPGQITKSATRPIGVHLMEFADLGTLVDFVSRKETQEYREVLQIIDTQSKRGDRFTMEVVKVDTIFQIIRQVVSALHSLQNNLDFNHGDLKAANIFVSSEASRGVYGGVDVTAPFTCKVADYGKSSLTIETDKGAYRIYNRSWLADRYLYINPFTPIINVEHDEPFFIVKGLFKVHLYTRTRHMGLPFYLAFDTYTFIVSLLIIPAFYYAFFSNPDLVGRVWNVLWFHDDAERMRQRVLGYHDHPKAEGIAVTLEILRDVRLRCDATQRLLESLRE